MKLEEIRAIAKSRGIHHGMFSITGLVHSIQTAEGNFDCFGTADSGECNQGSCIWRENCFVYSRPPVFDSA